MSAFGVAESPEGDSLYGSPPGRSFYSCASSRALLHIGLLSLWDRQPSNAPPLLLSPAGLASRRGPHTKTHLGLCPKTPNASEPPARKAKGRLPGAGLDDAYKVPQAHFYVEIVDRVPLPRCGEGGRGKGQMLPQATFGAHLCAVRICFSRLLREKQHS